MRQRVSTGYAHPVGGRYAATLLVLALLLAAAMADGGKQKDEGAGAGRPGEGQGGQSAQGSGCLPPAGAKTLSQVVLPSPSALFSFFKARATTI